MPQFDTVHTTTGLGITFCPSNKIAKRLRRQRDDANAKRKEYERLYNDLKNSPQQNEIFRYEHLLKAKQQEIKRFIGGEISVGEFKKNIKILIS